MSLRRRISAAVHVTMVAFMFTVPVGAEVPASQIRTFRPPNPETREEEAYLARVPRSSEIDQGGWVAVSLYDFREDDNDGDQPDQLEGLSVIDARVWLNVLWDSKTRAYLRLRAQEFDFRSLAGAVAPDVDLQEGLQVDLAEVTHQVNENVSVRGGRLYQFMGRGLALSGIFDGAEVTHRKNSWEFSGFLGFTPDRETNIDASIIGFDKEGTTKRRFTALTARKRTRRGASNYAYYLDQRDDSRSLDPLQSAVDFRYHSNYLGVGTDGSLDSRTRYYLELIHQGGSTLVDGAVPTRVDIDAQAAMAGIMHHPDHRTRPMATLQYYYGSGDPNRGSVTNTFGGKLDRTTDTNFLHFGTYDGGFALSPQLSNLHMLRASYYLHPLAHLEGEPPDVIAGLSLSVYRKDETDGVITDPEAVGASADIGEALDLSLGYRPFTDVSMLLVTSGFWPGDAYRPGDDTPTTRVQLTTVLNF